MRNISYSESVSDRGAKIIPFPGRYHRMPQPRLQRQKVFLKVGLIVCGIFIISLFEYILIWLGSVFMSAFGGDKIKRQPGV